MFMNFLTHLVALDVEWLVGLVMNNLLFLFMFVALIFIFYQGKKVLRGVIIMSLLAWAWIDLENIGGIVLFVGGFMLLYYITKLALLGFIENNPNMGTKLVLISEIQFIALVLFYNLFMR